MPLPKPHANEMHDEFMTRCMADPATQEMEGTNEQRAAACQRQFEDMQQNAALTGRNQLELKSFGAFEVKDAATGEVAAVVAQINVLDRHGDVFLPGSIPDGTKVQLSSYQHDMLVSDALPAGKGTISVAGDKVILKGRFFLSTERGRETFNTMKELEGDAEWSVSFPKATTKIAAMTDEWKSKGARRLIAGAELVEASPVHRGAQYGTRTLAMKEGAPPHSSLPASDPAVEKAAADLAAANAAAVRRFSRKPF